VVDIGEWEAVVVVIVRMTVIGAMSRAAVVTWRHLEELMGLLFGEMQQHSRANVSIFV
jgi:hypothetical protein